ncbi:PHD finger protein ALFIN-LIKE 8-like [Curcuma longa]|uniref:PHD finger protein ALFIN-LIKE 8-like n=1 Tax=Curcuma longa TaxID=136217 RepID=UPI003D9EAA3A
MDDDVRKPEQVFRDFRGRRSGIIKALTTDVEKFYAQCDPEKENLCLYGFPDETWEVNLPAEEVPPELPEPALGINFARDGMEENDWLALVAVHSDSWLLAVSFYFAARFEFNKETRMRLHSMINSLPTVYEVVTRTAKPSREKTSNGSSKSSKSSSKKQKLAESQKPSKMQVLTDQDSREDLEEEEHENTLCGACGDNYAADEFWICCDVCEKWFHGKCVRITPAKAEHIKQYKCPGCSSKRAK